MDSLSIANLIISIVTLLIQPLVIAFAVFITRIEKSNCSKCLEIERDVPDN